jgi:hypothetical protein
LILSSFELLAYGMSRLISSNKNMPKDQTIIGKQMNQNVSVRMKKEQSDWDWEWEWVNEKVWGLLWTISFDEIVGIRFDTIKQRTHRFLNQQTKVKKRNNQIRFETINKNW